MLDQYQRPAPWLAAELPSLQASIVRNAVLDVIVCEIPEHSNRSAIIDGYMDAVGSPRGMSWCAAAAAAWFHKAGAKIPPKDAGSVQAWLDWGKENGLLSDAFQPGFAVIYGDKAAFKGHHMGVMVRDYPWPCSVEGNTSVDTLYTTDGEAVWPKRTHLERVVAYLRPVPVNG